MGGRGSAGGVYGRIPRTSLESMLTRQETKLQEAKYFAHNTITKNTEPVIARRIRADTKKYDKAKDEIKKIQQALKAAGKRKNEPF